jgi:organic hydroperoxide reductase OsmC/OhrA
MSEHRATIEWRRATLDFKYETYNRSHTLEFKGGIRVPAGAAPDNVPRSVGAPPGVDPEQAFVAALSSCHMLWFLHLACQRKWVVERYVDEAVGVLERTWISRVILRPQVTFSGSAPGDDELRELHHRAHEKCFIANSVKTEVVIEC